MVVLFQYQIVVEVCHQFQVRINSLIFCEYIIIECIGSERNVEVEDGREIDEDGEHRGSEYGGSYPYMTYIPPTMTFIPPMSMSYTLPYYPQYPRYPYNSFPHMAALPLSPPTSNYTVPLLSDLVTNTTLTNNQHTSNNHTTNTLNHNNSPSNTQQTKKKNP